ncbi:YncE family protein [Peribacillus tepidiphilus]|uniref:YncE family protein n=1 Tax=Peribacillus tepidiphilus TaxID=2652445 RepID=UPI0012908B4A|nr:WD40 repeat domain-containing protein [Peribacillus tepidiphilus]
MKKKLTCLFFAVLVLSGCMNETYTQIPPDQAFISTINLKDGSLSFIDGNDYTELAKWELKKPITGGVLLPDQDTLMLYGKQMKSVNFYSFKKGKQIRKWDTGEGIVFAGLIHDNKVMALINQLHNRIDFFGLNGKEIASVKVGKGPISFVEDSDTNMLYVLNFHDTYVTVIHYENYKTVRKIPVNEFSTGLLIHKENDELWVGGHGKGATIEENIHIYSLDTGKLKRTIKAPSMPINFLQDGDATFIVSHGTSTLYKAQTNKKDLLSIKVGVNPFELVLFHKKLVVAGYDSNDVSIIDPDKMVVQHTIPVGKGPFHIVVRE